jgi:hypothetical protein
VWAVENQLKRRVFLAVLMLTAHGGTLETAITAVKAMLTRLDGDRIYTNRAAFEADLLAAAQTAGVKADAAINYLEELPAVLTNWGNGSPLT